MTARMDPAVHRFDAVEAALTEAEDRAAAFGSPGFIHALDACLEALGEGRDVLSLDVFDTLLLRDDSSELTRFREIGTRMAAIAEERLGQPVAPIDGLVARHLGTAATYRASAPVEGCREGSLRELHRCASMILAGTDALSDAFIAAELDVETARLAPNATLLARMDAAREAGKTVILITDMYMHDEHVADLLSRLGIAAERYDRLFSSAELKVSKASGRIFAHVEAALGREPEAFLHLGDSLRGDFANPRRRGWAAQHLPVGPAALALRQADHARTAADLEARHGFCPDIAPPH